MSTSIDQITIPAHLTSEAARAHAIKLLNGLQARIGAMQQAIADRDRIIQHRTADLADRDATIETLTTGVRALRQELAAARQGRSAAETDAEVLRLRQELDRWHTFGIEFLEGLKRLVEETRAATVPVATAQHAARPSAAEERPNEARAVSRAADPSAPEPGDGKGPSTRERDARAPVKARRTCSVGWCEKPHLSRGYCGRHYLHWQQYGDPLLTKRSRGQGHNVLMREVGPERYAPVEESSEP